MPARRAMLPPDGARSLSVRTCGMPCSPPSSAAPCEGTTHARAASVSSRRWSLSQASAAPPLPPRCTCMSCTPRGADTLHRQAAAPRCASVPLSRCASAPPLAGMRAELSLSLPPLTPQGRTWPVNATVTVTDCSGGSGAHVLAQLNISLWSGDAPADGGRGLLQQHRIPVRCRPCFIRKGGPYIRRGGCRAGGLYETRYA